MHSDVCLNQTEMTRILVEILLNKTFRSKDTDGSFRKESDVLSIVAYITQELFKLLTRLLSFTQIIIVEANKEIDLDNFNEHHKYVVPYQNFIATIDEQIQKFHWVKVAVIYLKNPTLDEEYFKFCYKSLVEIIKKRSNQCVQALSVDTTEPSSIDYALSLLTKESSFGRHTIVVIGLASSFNSFVQQIDSMKLDSEFPSILYLRDGVSTPITSPSNIKLYTTVNFARVFVFNYEKNFAIDFEMDLLFVMYQIVLPKFKVLHLPKDINKTSYFKRIVNLSKEKVWLPQSSNSTSTECSPITCGPGFTKTLGEISNSSTNWDFEKAFKCIRCLENHTKPQFGNDKCQLCPGYFISNEERTDCIDPFAKRQRRCFVHRWQWIVFNHGSFSNARVLIEERYSCC